MAESRYNYLRAILYPEDITEVGGGVMEMHCLHVKDYKYRCYRNRDEVGNPYGHVLSDYLEFSVKIVKADACHVFYKRLEERTNSPFSFIFNASFNERGRLKNFDDGMITNGYVVDIEESCANDDDSGEEQLMLHVKLLLSNINYLGMEDVHTLKITND